MKRKKIPSTCLLYLFISFFIVGFCPVATYAALIESIEFRGGGCDMMGGSSGNTSYEIIDTYVVNVTKDFKKTESESPDDDGGSGNKGKCNKQGMGGSHQDATSDNADSGSTHEQEELYERLPPIHMFITLNNSGSASTYNFSETIFNNTGLSWDGFLFALKRNEEGSENSSMIMTSLRVCSKLYHQATKLRVRSSSGQMGYSSPVQ